MKTTALRAGWAVGLAILTTGAAFRALADDATTAAPAKNEKHYTGTVLAVNPQEHTLRVRGFLFSKTFNLGDGCAYQLVDNDSGTLTGLRPGQKVTVSYQNASGVLAADRVEQIPLRYEGMVKTIDATNHTLTVQVRGMDRTFQLADDCKVTLRGDKTGALADVQPGNHITVTYETPHGTYTARAIAQTSETFTGTLTAIDLNERTVKAKSFLDTKNFHLGDHCAIVVNGKLDGHMRDLRPGEKLAFSYDDINGVNVVNRIATVGEPESSVAAEAK